MVWLKPENLHTRAIFSWHHDIINGYIPSVASTSSCLNVNLMKHKNQHLDQMMKKKDEFHSIAI